MAITSGPTRFLPGFTASGDLSSSQYKLVKLASTAGQVILGAAATDICVGVLYNEPTDGEAAQIAIGPVVKVQAEASVSVGTYVASNSTGQVQATTTTSDDVFGFLLEGSTSAGDLVSVLVGRFNHP